MRAIILTALFLLPVALGDGADPDDHPAFLQEDPGFAGTTSVVAVVDTGVNPFHELFRRPDLMAPGTLPVEAVDSETGKAPLYVPIEPVSDIEEGAWLEEILEPRTLYRFAGTNLLYYSMVDAYDELDLSGHGTGTAGMVTKNAPEVIIVMVQTTGHPLDEAVAWAAKQPWIDVVSTSWGCPENCLWPYMHSVLGLPQQPYASEDGDVASATAQAWASGKLVVSSAGNDGTTHWTDEDGAPWVISVGGANASQRTATFGPIQSPDLISDYKVRVPSDEHVTEYESARGTSFSAPTVAGTLAEAIRSARQAVGHTGPAVGEALVDAGGVRLTNSDFRHAMNESAVYWEYPGPYPPGLNIPGAEAADPDDGSCGGPCTEGDDNAPPLVTVHKQPVNPVAPWPEMGWGYLNGTHAPTLTAALVDGQWPPEKPLGARLYMEQRQQVRNEMWPQPGPLVDPELTDGLDPAFAACRQHLPILNALPYGSPCGEESGHA